MGIPETISLTIRSKFSGYSFDAEVPISMQIGHLITRIAKELGIAIFDQHVSSAIIAIRDVKTNMRLQENKQIQDYKLQSGDTLELYAESAAG